MEGFQKTTKRQYSFKISNSHYSAAEGGLRNVSYLIEKYALRVETVEVICEMYTRDTYSWWLNQRLEFLFKENKVKKEEFHSIALDKGYRIPDELK